MRDKRGVGFFDSMQTLYQNEDERCNGKGAGTMDLVIYAGRISRYVERECNRRSREWKFELCNSREVSNRSEKIIWWWRW